MNRWLLLGVILLVAIGAVAAYASRNGGMPVQTDLVARGTIHEFVDERATTRLPETHLITMPFPGRIEPIDLIEGQRVQAGDVVARISQQDLEQEVAEARAAVERLQASITENAHVAVEMTVREQAQLFAESLEATVSAAEARTVASQGRVDFTERVLGRSRQLTERGVETQEELERAELDYIESRIGYRQDVLTVDSLKSIQAATVLLPRIVTEQIDRRGLAGNVLEKERQEAEARLQQVLLRRQRGEMTSPVDGVVLERAVRDEQFLPSGATLLRIGELDRLEVEAEILSEDVVQIQEGDAVEIYGAAIGSVAGAGVPGRVARIFPTGFTKISSLGVEQQRVRVVIHFAEDVLSQLRAERFLGVDYRVRVRIFTADRTDTLIVPRSALFRGANGAWEVFVVRAGRAHRQPVEVGLMNDERAEILDGLAERQSVVLAPESGLQDGARVRQ